MEFIKSNKYDKKFIEENLMGPNSMKMLEELLQSVKLEKDMRVLDLGCGRGLTSILLAKEFGVQVFATDLWISASQNYKTFKSMGLENQIIPIHADAIDLPYANEYFDAIVSIDSYHYSGTEPEFMDTKIAPLVKKDGTIAIAFPGVKKELNGVLPDEMMLSWEKVKDEIFKTFHSIPWWKELLSKSNEITIESIQEMQCFEECWNDWLACDNEYVEYSANDRLSMEAGAGKYMNLIAIIAKRK
ncbi:MAG: methyltransferase domain-containing protein [Candidatus Gastranaerophilaceae bacterium]